jgi:NAD(P)-dependent dehydrogenase (short-subunit alcohol dehydrogenase family)
MTTPRRRAVVAQIGETRPRRVVAVLARDEAAALTGQTLTVDGGLVMR